MVANPGINYHSDDETLVYYCLTGDESAFGFLVHKYKDLIHAYVYQKVSNYADAEDITQEVFIRAYRKLAQLKYPHKFRSWLYTIASNECKRWLSKKRKRQEKEVNLEEVPEDAFGFEVDFARAPTDWQVDLEKALEGLSEDKRIAVSMFYMSDCSLKDIGEYLGVSVNTVKSKLHRARQQLGNALSEHYGRALSRKKLKGGFIMKIMQQLRNLSRPPMIPPAWQGNLLRQIPIAVATAACILVGAIGVFSRNVNMSEPSSFVLGKEEQSSAQIVETVWLGTLPAYASPSLTRATAEEKEDSQKDAQALAEADALLAAKKYRQAAGAYRLLLEKTSSDEIAFAAYYGLGMSLYKWDRPVGNWIDEAIGMVMMIPKESEHWSCSQVLLGRCFLRKYIWAREDEQRGEYYDVALQAFQDVLSTQTTDDLRKQSEYLRTLCKVERGDVDPKTSAARKHLEMALQDEDAAIRFVAADALDMPIPGMRIVGAVTDKLTGQPVANAPVSIMYIGNDTTDGQGRFSIDNLPGRKGEAIIWVDVKGYGKRMVRVMISETESETQVDVQLGQGATVVGRIVDSDGQPIDGANVRIIGDYYPLRFAITDAEGKYQLENIETRQDRYYLGVEHPGFIDVHNKISVSKTGIVETPDVVLKRGSTLRGRMTDEAGNPVQGVPVTTKGGSNVSGNDGEDKTDANGEYHLKNVSSLYADATIVVDSPQFMPAYKQVRLDPGKELPPVNFVLKPGKTLVGRVVDEQDNPIEGVRLQLQTWGELEYSWYNRFATTDANGFFRMEHLPEGKTTLRLDKEGYLYMNDQPAEVEPDKSITTMKENIVMQKGVRAYAKVVDAKTDKPIKNFRVKAASPKELEAKDIAPDGLPGDWASGFVFQSDTGEFETFERFRGMVIALQVEADGYAPTYVPRVVLGAYDKKEPLIIRMKAQASIKGIVVDAETGKPLAGAFITTFDKNHPLFIHGVAPEHLSTGPVRTDAGGKFTLPGALAEEFYLYVTHPERADAIAGRFYAPTDGKTPLISVEMQKGCVLTGTATPGLTITINLLKDNPYLMVDRRTQASRDGIYRFENLTPGKHRFDEMIPGEGFSSSGRSIFLELQPGETKTLNLLRTGGALLYGQVTEADGAPIKNVFVEVTGVPLDVKFPPPPDMKLSPEMIFKIELEYSGAAITNADGRYEIAGLPPGNYQLKATVKNFPKPGEMKAIHRAGKLPKRKKPRKTTSTFTIEKGDQKLGLDIVFPEKE